MSMPEENLPVPENLDAYTLQMVKEEIGRAITDIGISSLLPTQEHSSSTEDLEERMAGLRSRIDTDGEDAATKKGALSMAKKLLEILEVWQVSTR